MLDREKQCEDMATLTDVDQGLEPDENKSVYIAPLQPIHVMCVPPGPGFEIQGQRKAHPLLTASVSLATLALTLTA